MRTAVVGLAFWSVWAPLPAVAEDLPEPTVDPWAILGTTLGEVTDHIRIDGCESCACSGPTFADDTALEPAIEPPTLAEGDLQAGTLDLAIDFPPVVPDRLDPAAPALSVRLEVTRHRGVSEWRGSARLAYGDDSGSSGRPDPATD